MGGGYTVSNVVVEGREVDNVPTQDDATLIQDLRRFWEMEAIGIAETSQGDDSTFLSDIAFDCDKGRYRVWLPWKSDRRPEHDCYQFCLSRLKHLQGRLQGNSLMSIEYDTTVQKQLQ